MLAIISRALFVRCDSQDHTKTSTELKSAVAGIPNAPIPTALDSSHQSKLDKLKGLNGADRQRREGRLGAQLD
jgi:putative membrane protein